MCEKSSRSARDKSFVHELIRSLVVTTTTTTTTNCFYNLTVRLQAKFFLSPDVVNLFIAMVNIICGPTRGCDVY